MARIAQRLLLLIICMQMTRCVPDVIKPSLVAQPGPGQSFSAFTEADARCAADANIAISPARDEANAALGRMGLLSLVGIHREPSHYKKAAANKAKEAGDLVFGGVSSAIDNEASAYFMLRRRLDFLYARCLSAKGYQVPGYSRPISVAASSASPVPDLWQQASDRLLGTWTGSYVCGDKDVGVDLTFDGLDGDGVVTATFDFYQLPRNGHEIFGSYTMVGEYDIGKQRLYLVPGEWIKRPPRYIMVAVHISFPAAGEDQMHGVIVQPGCEAISVKRVASQEAGH